MALPESSSPAGGSPPAAAAAAAALQLADEQGFALTGIAPADPSPFADHVQRWIASGQHGEMDYLERHLELRLDVKKLLPGARAVLCVADRYPDAPQPPPEGAAPSGEQGGQDGATAIGRVARYAWGRDYHKVIKKRLFKVADALAERYPGHTFRCCIDTAPLMEREHAARAGIGWVGKHTLILHPRLGSWLLLGFLVTTLPMQPSAEAAGVTSPPLGFFGHGFEGCGTCTRCIDACPTDCIDPAGYSLDATRCISYLTIEHRGRIDPSLHEPMGDWIAGCDVCQEVCPFNQPQRLPGQPPPPADYAPRPIAGGVALSEVLGWTEADRRRAFEGSALKRIRYDMLLRNAAIAAGNALQRRRDAVLESQLERLASDAEAPELARHTAAHVLSSLKAQREMEAENSPAD